MKTNHQLISPAAIMLIVVLSISSCAPVLYSNVGQNVPLFQEKGEVALSAGYSSAADEDGWSSGSGFNGQFAIAVGHSTAVMSSFYSLKDDENKGSYFELGIGKFKYSEKSKLTAEIFAGTGFGSIKNLFDSDRINVKYIKPFIQPSVGFSSPYFEIAFTPRIALVSYTSKSATIADPINQNSFADFWSEKRNTLVLEPGITTRLGYKNVRLQAQYSGTTFNYDWNDGTEKYSAVLKNFISVGLFILISDRWATSTEKAKP